MYQENQASSHWQELKSPHEADASEMQEIPHLVDF